MEKDFYLAVEVTPNNYFPVNLLDLNISNGFNSVKLEEIDNFTLRYTKEEILNAIKSANMLDVNNDMPLVVIYNEKDGVRKSMALTKDINFDMWTYIKDNYHDKAFINKVYNFLRNKVSVNVANSLKQTNNLEQYINTISSLDYLLQRKLYFYLYEK